MIGEILLLVGLVGLTAYMLKKRHVLRHGREGYRAVLVGLMLATVSSSLALLLFGEQHLVVGTPLSGLSTQWLTMFGYVPAVLIIAMGIGRWLPALERLDQEIVARERAEAGLRRTEALLRDAIGSLNDAFVVYDDQDRLVMLNERQRTLFSSIGDLLEPGATFESLLRAQVERGQIQAAIGKEEEWIARRLEQHRNPQGEIIQHFANGQVIRLVEHRTELGGTVSVRTDITDLYRSQKTAERAASAVRVLLETAPVPLAVLRDDDLLFANRQMHELLGAKMGALSGRRGADLLTDIERYEELLANVRADGAVTGFDASVRTDSGQEIWATISAATVDYDGGPAIFLGLLDITVRRDAERAIAESEARFRTIAEGSPMPLCIGRRSDGALLYTNEAFRKVLGLPDEDLSDRSIMQFFVDPKAHERQIDEVVRHGEISGWQVEMRSEDGRRLSTRHSVRSIELGGQRALLGVFTDVTEQERTQRELAEAKRAAEAANISKSQFLAVMSHELRTPLNAILGFSEVLRDQLLGPIENARYTDYAKDIHDSGQHLLSLISDVLDLSRIEAGKLELNEVTIDPLQLARECIHYFDGKAREHRTRLVLNDRSGGTRLCGDERAVKQILLNLMSNAVKFARNDTDVDVDIELTGDGGLAFNVFNRGDGIAAADLQRIMQPFTQLQNAHTRSEHGTGLGLSITRHLTQAHGGTLELRSDLGVGTTATAAFPARRSVPTEPEALLAAQ